MRVLVTGGAGFIGSNLCRRLVSTDGIERVVVLDDLSTGSADNLVDLAPSTVDLRIGSILDDVSLQEATNDVTAIVHLAARPSVARSLVDPLASHLANATGTINVLEAARRKGIHVIVASSSSVYGATSTLPKHENLPTRPMSPYAASKLATEAYAVAYAHSFGLPTMVFRLFNVFGPHQPAGHAYAAVVPAFIDAALAGRPLTINGDGTQTRDFTFVDTVATVIIDAVVRRVSDPEPVNLAFGTRTELLNLVELLERLIGHPITRRHGPPRSGDVAHSQADSTRLRALFPDVVPVPLEDGLARTVEWMRSVSRA